MASSDDSFLEVVKGKTMPKKSNTTNTAKKQQLSRKSKGAGTALNDLFIVVFAVMFVLSVSLNLLHATETIEHIHETPVERAVADFKLGKHKKLPSMSDIDLELEPDPDEQVDRLNKEKEGPPMDILRSDSKDSDIQFPTLDCQAFGGPSKEVAQEMVYWADISSDAQWQSPFRAKTSQDTKYLTFEPDGGGWNNIRMAMESVIGLAIAMGRTLVMPPQKKMYLLGKNDNHQSNHFSFVDFFPIEEMAKEHVGLDVITMQEYLQQEAMTGKLKNKETGLVEFPPGNRTEWDGIDQQDYDALREYLRRVTYTPVWNPGKCLPAFPSSGDHRDVLKLQQLVHKARDVKQIQEGNPVNVEDPNPMGRLEETLAGRTQLCVYDEELQQQPGLHFQCNHKLKIRMLVHFYAFLFFEDWKEDMWMKRFVRDHVRYIDEIQCAAARVVEAVRNHVRKRSGDPTGTFDTFHIRRGDFQFKKTRIDAVEIFQNSKDELTLNGTIFVATDERNKKFFDPLKEHYDLLFLDDFQEELKGVNTNYYGMIDQLVASRGRVFFGCYWSTFTGYINRIRGYHSVKDKAPGYEDGVLPTTYYYATLDKKFIMHTYAPLRGGFFNRENPTSWRDINKGIGMLPLAAS